MSKFLDKDGLEYFWTLIKAYVDTHGEEIHIGRTPPTDENIKIWIDTSGDGVPLTVTGISPLAFTNAVAENITSLIQYGKCVQSGTPTPEAPVDIVCNNGTIRMVDPDLPVGYKRLTGISFDGNFHYETGEYLTGDDDVTMTLDNPSSSGVNVFGSFNGGTSGSNFSFYIIGSSSSGSYFRFGNQLKRPVYGGPGTEQRTITFGASGTSGFTVDTSVDPAEFTSPANVYIGMLPNSSSPSYDGDIIGSILVGTRLEWIPCESGNGVIGYYERVKGNFIAPTGDGTPVSLGYDTSHLTLGVAGTPEVLSVGGANLFYNDEAWEQGLFLTNGKVTMAAANRTFVTRCSPNTTYYWKHCTQLGGVRAFTVDENEVAVGVEGTWIKQNPLIGKINEVYSATTGANAKWLCVCFGQSQGGDAAPIADQWSDFMLSTIPLTADTPYEAYQTPQTVSVVSLYAVGDYKDEKNIVTGAVTRRVGVRVLDGTETWGQKNATDGRIIMRLNDAINQASAPIIVTHGRWSTSSVKDSDEWRLLTGPYLCCYSSLETTDDFKARLAAQYAAGTPYIVMYPLAEEQTEQVDPQPIIANDGDNVIIVSSAVGEVELKVEYLGVE